jgi:hypothetical protein
MVSTTKCAFCWGISGFRAVRTVVLATTFDARIWSVAISACVSIILATCTLWDVIFICSWWFYVNDFILYGLYFVNFFVVCSRFEVNKKQIEWFFSYPMANVHYISGHVSLLQQVMSAVFYLGGTWKVKEYHSIGPLLFYLVSMIVDVHFLEVFDERSIGFWGYTGYLYDVVCQSFCVELFGFGYLIYSVYHFVVVYHSVQNNLRRFVYLNWLGVYCLVLGGDFFSEHFVSVLGYCLWSLGSGL